MKKQMEKYLIYIRNGDGTMARISNQERKKVFSVSAFTNPYTVF